MLVVLDDINHRETIVKLWEKDKKGRAVYVKSMMDTWARIMYLDKVKTARQQSGYSLAVFGALFINFNSII